MSVTIKPYLRDLVAKSERPWMAASLWSVIVAVALVVLLAFAHRPFNAVVILTLALTSVCVGGLCGIAVWAGRTLFQPGGQRTEDAFCIALSALTVVICWWTNSGGQLWLYLLRITVALPIASAAGAYLLAPAFSALRRRLGRQPEGGRS